MSSGDEDGEYNRPNFSLNPNNVTLNPNDFSMNSSMTAAILSASSLKMEEFKCRDMAPSAIREEWKRWIRGAENVLAAGGITEPLKMKQLLLAWGGLQLQDVFYSIPGADVVDDDSNVFELAVAKLTKFFSPKQHETYERHKFWSMKINDGESIDKFLHRVRTQANNCNFGSSVAKSREISIIDKIIASAPPPLKEKLLQREKISLESLEKTVNSYQAVKEQTRAMSFSGEREISVNRMTNRYNSNSQPTRTPEQRDCQQCGYTNHDTPNRQCPALNAICHKCGFKGHFQSQCTTRKRSYSSSFPRQQFRNKRFRPVRQIESHEMNDNAESSTETQQYEDHEKFNVYNIGESDDLVWCNVAGTEMEMCIDSGSKHNLIDDKTYRMMKQNNSQLINERDDRNVHFYAYGRFPLQVLSVFEASIRVVDQNESIEQIATFYVIRNGQQPLLGKDTAKSMGLLHIGLPSCQRFGVFGAFVSKRPFPKISDVQIRIPIDKRIVPVQQSKRGCPAAMFIPLKAKMDELLEQDIIEEAPSASEWVSPLVPVLKDNGDIRICVDMRKANMAILRENHPLPTIDALLAQLGNASCFSKLDFKNGFHQIEIHPDSRPITTFISPWGLYRYKRLCFGINCAPEMFQKIVEQILVGCENTLIFIDDIVVYGATEKEHDRALQKVLAALKKRNVMLNHEKCELKKNQITFLGHRLSRDGVRPTEDKVAAIKNCREPKTKEELRSFLGLVTFVAKFIPNLTTITAPLRELLKKDVHFSWTKVHREIFEELKGLITSTTTLGYFDLKDRTRLVTDASGVGLGAVLIQFNDENIPRIIYYASKSLSNCEKRFSPTEREALAIVWGVERFKMYLLGHEFELETDHQPLVTIFGENSRPCARIERWVLRLMAYRFKIVYRRGKTNLADCLSRLAEDNGDFPFSEESPVFVRSITEALALLTHEGNPQTFDEDVEYCVKAIHMSAALDVYQIEAATEVDEELQKLKIAIESDDWSDVQLKLYEPFKREFGYTGNLIVRNSKLIIPRIYRTRMLDLAHEGHPGQTAMKTRIRSTCWWPKIDMDVENYVSKCKECLWTSLPDRPDVFKPRPLPSKPWVDLGMDFLGPLPTGESLLVVIDYYSRYMEVKIVKDQSAKTTRECLDEIFTRLGFPYTLQFDNARQFVSQEITNYCSDNGITWINTTPYWPQANGEVERQNRSLMRRLRIGYNSHGDWKAELRQFLKTYYTTPHTTTGKAPTELLGRLIRSRLPSLSDIALKPIACDFTDRDQLKKFLGGKKENERRRARTPDLKVGDTVLMKNLLGGNKFSLNFNKEEFEIIAINGSNVTIKEKNGHRIFDRNVAHLKRVPIEISSEPEDHDQHQNPNEEVQSAAEQGPTSTSSTEHSPQQQQPLERPKRTTRLSSRLHGYQLN